MRNEDFCLEVLSLLENYCNEVLNIQTVVYQCIGLDDVVLHTLLGMYTYTYTHMCIYSYTYTFTYTYKYKYTYTYITCIHNFCGCYYYFIGYHRIIILSTNQHIKSKATSLLFTTIHNIKFLF